MRCPSCDHDNRADRRFCGQCGAALVALCAACGTPNEPGDSFCGGCGAALTAKVPAIADATPGRALDAALPAGERRQLTVLFFDLVGSTPLSQRLDPEDWRDVVTRYHATARTAVERFGGHVAKLLGDGVLVYFGWPTAREDDPERAIRAGLEMLDAMGPLNAQLAFGDGMRLSIRAGMHTGLVVVAEGGEIFGDTPNIAARVQSAADPGTVVITGATQRLVTGLFIVEERGPQALKGVREPVSLYRVLQPSGVRSRLHVSPGRQMPFVGRQAQLGVLCDAWELAVEGSGQAVLVQGEAGLGKSRLCYELRARLRAEPHTWLECRCSPYALGTPFRPLIELAEQMLSFEPMDTPSDKLAKLVTTLARGGLADGDAVALIAEWLELPESAGYTALPMSADLKRRKTLDALAGWHLLIGQMQPVLVLIEDLHWCDPSSLELLGRLMLQSARGHLLMVATARPEFRNPWPPRSTFQTVTLGRFSKRQTREMIVAMSAERALPETVVEELVTRAGGIPLFAEELTQEVLEAGSDAAAAAIPATLQDSLLARLDRLSGAKEVALRAAVLGREFSYNLLAAIAGLDTETLQQGLARLVEAEIVFARGVPPDVTYTFKHALMQEAAYALLLKRARQQLHSRVVDVLVSELPGHAAAAPEMVARHAELAGRMEDAIAHHRRAGEQAQARSAHAEAIGHLRHAIALLTTRPEEGERDIREAAIQLALAGSLVPARGFAHPEVEVAYERARVLCETGGDARQLGLALSGLSSACSTRGEVERGGALAARVLAAADQSGDRELALLGHVALAFDEYYQGHFASALAHAEAGRSLYEPGRHHALVSTLSFDPGVAALSFGAWSLWTLGRSDHALARAREAVALAYQLAHPFSVVEALFYEVAVHWQRRDHAAQRQRADEVVALSEANTFPEFVGAGRAFQAAARVAAGETGAVADLLAGLSLTAETGSQAGAPGMFALLGAAYKAAGQLVESRGALETGLAVAAVTGQTFFDADLHRLQGECLLAQEDKNQNFKEAEECFHRSLAIARAQEAKSFELRAASSLACLWRDQGKLDAARELLAPLYTSFTEGFDTPDLQDAKALLDDL